MGIAKSIEAYTVYDNYTSDTDVFIQQLSHSLNADFTINTFDEEYNRIGRENRVTKFNKSDNYRLTITIDDYKIDKKTIQLPTYEVSIPVKYIYEDSIEFTFYPNNSVHIMFLTFEHLWGSFIDQLKFDGYEDRAQLIRRYQVLRKEYTDILHKLGISQIYITTHAYFEIEGVTDAEVYNKLTLDQIAEIAQEKDKLTIFNFQHILNATDITELDQKFIDKSYLEILLLDTFNTQ